MTFCIKANITISGKQILEGGGTGIDHHLSNVCTVPAWNIIPNSSASCEETKKKNACDTKYAVIENFRESDCKDISAYENLPCVRQVGETEKCHSDRLDPHSFT